MKLFDDGYVKVKVVDPNLPVVIAFSIVNTSKGRFKPFKMVDECGLNVIFVNDAGNHWYTHGIEGVSNHAVESAKLLVDYARKVGNGRVITFGSSMGAYGAILYCLLGLADGFLAFGSEVVLELEGTRSEQHLLKAPDQQFSDIRKYIKTLSVPNYVFIPENDIVDLLSFNYFREYENVNLVFLSASSHPGLDIITKPSKLIYDFGMHLQVNLGAHLKSYQLSGQHGYYTSKVVQCLYESYISFRSGKFEESLSILLSIENDMKGNSMYNLKLGEAYKRVGNNEQAIKHWYLSLDSNKYQYESIAKISAEKMRAKEYKEAKQMIDEAIDIFPFSSFQYNTRGMILNELGDYLGAESSFRKAIKLNEGNKGFQLNLRNFLLEDIVRKTNEVEKTQWL